MVTHARLPPTPLIASGFGVVLIDWLIWVSPGERREELNGGSGRVGGWSSGTSAALKSPSCASDEEDVSRHRHHHHHHHHHHHNDSDDNIDVLESDDEELDLLSSDSCLSGHDGVPTSASVVPAGAAVIPPTAAAMMMASVLPTSSASTELGNLL